MEKRPVEASREWTSKLDELIEAKLRREYNKAVRRISKRKWRVPEILDQLTKVKGKDRKKLEDELKLLMRKAKIDNEIVKKFEGIYSGQMSASTNENQEAIKKRPRSKSLDGKTRYNKYIMNLNKLC